MLEANNDDTVWLANGGPGVVIGHNHGKIAVAWPNLIVSHHRIADIAYVEPFSPTRSTDA